MKKRYSDRIKSLIFLAFGVFGLNFAFAIYGSTYTNFLVNDLNINAFQIGLLESIREVPGLLTAFILGSILHFSHPLLAGLFLLIFGFGMRGISTVNSWIEVVCWSVIWSIGFHCWNPLRSSITLSLSEEKNEGRRLGQMNSVSFIAAMVAMAFVAIFSSMVVMQYRLFFVMAGGISIFGGVIVLRVRSKQKTLKRTRLVFRNRYSIYYILNFLDGARRQIFNTFAPFALVKIYGLDVTMIALLMFVSRALTFLSSPYLGKLVDKVRPRIMLTAGYALMIGEIF